MKKLFDTRFLTKDIIDAYTEIVYGIMILRIPDIQNYLIPNFPEATVKSSYSNSHEDFIIVGKNILEVFRNEGLKNISSLKNSFNHVNRIFILSMWEILTIHQNYDKISTQPEIQFFRHIRNACAHDGKLNFSELKNEAKWRDKEIKADMFGVEIFPNILMAGDPILLMIDINNKYFTQVDYKK